MKEKLQNKYIAWGVTIFSVIFAAILVFFIIYRWDTIFSFVGTILTIMMPVVYGVVIAYLMNPLVKFFDVNVYRKLFKKDIDDKNKITRVLALITSTLLFIGIIVLIVTMLLPEIVKSLSMFINNANTYLVNSKDYLIKLFGDGSISDLINKNYDNIANIFNKWINDGFIQNFIISVKDGIFVTIKFLYNLIVGFIISIYVLFDKEKFKAQIKKVLYSFLDISLVNNILENVRYTDKIFGNFFSAKLIDSLIVGILCFIGCLIIDVPYSLVISVIVGVTNIIPYFGPFIGAVPSALLILLVTPNKCITFLIFVFILQQFDGNVLGPKIMGSKTGLSSFWVLFSLLIFGGLFGVVGMLVGVPLFSIIYSVIDKIIKDRLNKKQLPVESIYYENINYINEKTGKPVYFKKKKRKKVTGDKKNECKN